MRGRWDSAALGGLGRRQASYEMDHQACNAFHLTINPCYAISF
jgi:hypothetical protein